MEKSQKMYKRGNNDNFWFSTSSSLSERQHAKKITLKNAGSQVFWLSWSLRFIHE